MPEGTWEVISAGTNAKEGREATDFARVVADEEGVDLSAHLSSPLTVEQVRLSDYIFTMSRQQAEKVAGLDPQAARRTRLLGAFATTPNTSSLPADPLHSPAEDDEVPDPIGEDLELHRESGRRIVTAVERAALWLRRGGLPAAAPPPAARWLKPRPAHAQVPVPAPRQAVGASSRRQG